MRGSGSRVAAGQKKAEVPNVAEFAERNLKELVEVRCKQKTAKRCRQVSGSHTFPTLGIWPALAVSRWKVMVLHEEQSTYPMSEDRSVAILSRIFSTVGAPFPCIRGLCAKRRSVGPEPAGSGTDIDGLAVWQGVVVSVGADSRLSDVVDDHHPLCQMHNTPPRYWV